MNQDGRPQAAEYDTVSEHGSVTIVEPWLSFTGSSQRAKPITSYWQGESASPARISFSLSMTSL